jgi:hypothetical protein
MDDPPPSCPPSLNKDDQISNCKKNDCSVKGVPAFKNAVLVPEIAQSAQVLDFHVGLQEHRPRSFL